MISNSKKLPSCFAASGKKDLLRRSVVVGASALTLSTGLINESQAAPCTDNSTLIATSCTGPLNWSATAGTIVNNGTISSSSPGAAGLTTNVGTISGTLTSLTNNGLISASSGPGIQARWSASGGTLVNNGTISASTAGVSSTGGTITSLTNNGLISANNTGISANLASIGTLVNTGTIMSPTNWGVAIFGGRSIGTIVNTGTIYNGIINISTNPTTIVGVTDGSDNYGVIYAPAGATPRTIRNSLANLVFSSGNTQLDIDVLIANHTMSNTGASLKYVANHSITGNYSQTGGKLVFGALSPTSFAKLSITGTASLTGGNIVLLPLSNTQAGSYTIVSAASGLTNTLNTTATGYTVVTSVVGGKDLVVTLTLAPVVVPVVPVDNSGGSNTSVWTIRATDAGGEAVAIGPVLDSLAGNSDFQSLLASLSGLSTPEQNQALKQLGNSQAGTTQAVAGGATFALTTAAIGQRQSALVAAQGMGKAAGSQPVNTGVWGQVLGGKSSLSAANGFHATAYGMSFGADRHVTDDLIAGGAFSWLHNDLTGQSDSTGSNSELNSYQLGAYSAWRPSGGPAYLDGLLSVGSNRFSQSRNIDFLNTRATADYSGWQVQAKIGGGYDIPLNSQFTFTPLASLQAVRVKNDGYQEQGAGAANLAVAKQGFNNVESELAGKFTTWGKTSAGRLTGDAQLGWAHSFTNNAISTSATMGGASFVSTTERLAKDGAHVVLRATLQRTDQLSLSLEYDGSVRSHYRSQNALLKMRYEF